MQRSRRSRRVRQLPASPAEVPIPDKAYFRIGEVSRLTRTKPYVLRYWETEFPTLRPAKTPSGHRLYRRDDVETVMTIKRLLYQEGFTIEGARRQLSTASEPGAPREAEARTPNPQYLSAVKRELQGILTILSRKT